MRAYMTKLFVDTDEVFRQYMAMSSKQPKPTAGELEILRVLWDSGPCSVREIQRTLNQIKPTVTRRFSSWSRS